MGIIDNLKILTGKKKISDKPAVSSPTHHKKVLIVEDEKPLADTLESSFKDEGFTVIKAENGEVGLKLLQLEKPDIVLLDLLMPIMDGKSMLRRMRELPNFKLTPVIVLTNAGEIENIRETQFYSGAEEFFIKSNVSIAEVVRKSKDLVGIIQVINPNS
jgi:DNA-binding response OmpR family regulator